MFSKVGLCFYTEEPLNQQSVGIPPSLYTPYKGIYTASSSY